MKNDISIHPISEKIINSYQGKAEKHQYLTWEIVDLFRKHEDENWSCEEEVMIIAKYYMPDGFTTWYTCRYDEDAGLFTGFVLKGTKGQWGEFFLKDLETVNGSTGLPIERVIDWVPKRFSDLESFEKGE